MPRILVVDDDPETCRFMNELLREPEREIELAETPQDALARLARAASTSSSPTSTWTPSRAASTCCARSRRATPRWRWC